MKVKFTGRFLTVALLMTIMVAYLPHVKVLSATDADGNLAYGKPVVSYAVAGYNSSGPNPYIVTDGDTTNNKNLRYNDGLGWLYIDLGAETTFNQVVIYADSVVTGYKICGAHQEKDSTLQESNLRKGVSAESHTKYDKELDSPVTIETVNTPLPAAGTGQTITFDQPQTYRYVQFEVVSKAGGRFSVFEVEVYSVGQEPDPEPIPNVNHAFGGTATANGNLSGAGPENAIDNSTNTYWTSGKGGLPDFTLELKQRALINRIVIQPTSNTPTATEYKIELSDGGLKWDVIHGAIQPMAGTEATVFDFDDKTATHIKLTAFAKTTEDARWGFSEIEVFYYIPEKVTVKNVAIFGEAHLGGELTVNYDFLPHEDVQLEDLSTVQWYSSPAINDGWEEMQGVTGKTITVTEPMKEKYIMAAVTAACEDFTAANSVFSANVVLAGDYAFQKASYAGNEVSGRESYNAFDGLADTFWRTVNDFEPMDNANCTVNLAERYPINKLKLLTSIDDNSTYKILVSLDNVNWTQAYEGDHPLGGETNITFAQPIIARYVRYQAVERKGTGVRNSLLYEMNVLCDATDEQLAKVDVDDVNLGDLSNVTGNLNLIFEGFSGSEISWRSTSEKINVETGEVTRPTYEEGDIQVTLTASATLNGCEPQTRQFNITLIKMPMFYFKSLIFKDKDQTWINEIRELPANDEMEIVAVVKKGTSQQTGAVLVAALYGSGDRLLKISANNSIQSAIPLGEELTFTIPFDIDFVPTPEHHIKLFLLDGLTNVKPYVAAERFPRPLPPNGECIYTDPSQQSFLANANPNLPNVLVMGDSISIGYTPYLRELLSNRANVYIIPENSSHTANGIGKMSYWLGYGQMNWSVIVFNFGLHDLRYSDYDAENGTIITDVEQYGKNLGDIIAIMRAAEQGANLVWCTTTPVPEGAGGRIAGSEMAYNAVSTPIMAANDIRICDFAADIPNLPAYHKAPNDVHFSEEGYALMAETLSETVKASLFFAK
ncbi:MAG: discoidin domain-containing protein [Firmicutes bacterium]|nr:discoidin domain-containing protein [Bacillota bacterium]